MQHNWKPNIFSYIDYRVYLQAYYDAAKEHSKAFSYRYFARRAGYSSPSFLRHVMRGERNLSAESVKKFSEAMDLDEEESAFFGALVEFDQATSPEERSQTFEVVAASRRFRMARRIDSALFEYLSRWYYPAIREMTARKDFSEDPAWIASQLVPPISAEQASEAMNTLLDLKLVTRDASGHLKRGEPSLATEHEVRSMGVVAYHKQMLQRAAESIENVARERRDLAAMTVCISPETAAEIKQRIHNFRELLLEICDRDPDPRIVYQINSQLFPLSQWEEREERAQADKKRGAKS